MTTEELRQRLVEFRSVTEAALRDFDRLTAEQYELLRTIAARIDADAVAKARAKLNGDAAA